MTLSDEEMPTDSIRHSTAGRETVVEVFKSVFGYEPRSTAIIDYWIGQRLPPDELFQQMKLLK